MTFIPAGGRRFAFGHPAVTATNVYDDAMRGGLDCTPPGVADTGAPTEVTPNVDAYAHHASGVESPWPPTMCPPPPPAPVVEHVDLTEQPLGSARTASMSHRAGQIATTPAPGE